MRERHDTVIVGGGQAGLAMSAVLQLHGREHVVMERAGSANGGGRSGGIRSGFSSRIGRCSFPDTATPAMIPTVSRAIARSLRLSRSTRRTFARRCGRTPKSSI